VSTDPEKTCHECEYDMTGRAIGDLCPECGTPFEGLPRERNAMLLSNTALLGASLAAASMVFIPFLSIVLTFMALLFAYDFRMNSAHLSVPSAARRRMRLASGLAYFSIVEFAALMALSHRNPDLFNWW